MSSYIFFSGRGIDVAKIVLEELKGLLPVGFGIGSAIFYYLERRYKQLMLVGVVVAVVLGLPLTVAGIVSAVSHPRCKGLLITGIVLPIVGIPLVVVAVIVLLLFCRRHNMNIGVKKESLAKSSTTDDSNSSLPVNQLDGSTNENNTNIGKGMGRFSHENSLNQEYEQDEINMNVNILKQTPSKLLNGVRTKERLFSSTTV